MVADRKYISTHLAKTRDYLATKKALDNLMYKYEEYVYKCHEIKPPAITPNYEIKYEMFSNHVVDKLGNYVAKKLDYLQEVDNFYHDLAGALELLCKEELEYFNDNYFLGLSEITICEKLNIGEGSLRRIKESCVLKIAMYFDIDVKIDD